MSDSAARLRERLPDAVGLIHDDYHPLAIGFGGTERAADAGLSIANLELEAVAEGLANPRFGLTSAASGEVETLAGAPDPGPRGAGARSSLTVVPTAVAKSPDGDTR